MQAFCCGACTDTGDMRYRLLRCAGMPLLVAKHCRTVGCFHIMLRPPLHLLQHLPCFSAVCRLSCRTVLTHFSQRYPRMPADFPADAMPWRKRPLLAVDGAVVRFDLLPVLPALMPAVAAALADVAEGEEGEEEPTAAAAVSTYGTGGCCG